MEHPTQVHTGCLGHRAAHPDRRNFLRLAAMGGATLFLGVRPLRAAGGTDVLLLSCMDYRLMGHVASYMAKRDMAGKYDHIVLAGASIGVLNQTFPTWGRTFWDHVKVAIDLHQVKTLMIMDHRDCGAYKVFLGADHAKTRAAETEAHAAQLYTLRDQIKANHAALKTELLLMELDGSVEAIA